MRHRAVLVLPIIFSALMLVVAVSTVYAESSVNGVASGFEGGSITISYVNGYTKVTGTLEFSSITIPSGKYFVFGKGSLYNSAGQAVFSNVDFNGYITVDSSTGTIRVDVEVNAKPLIPISLTYKLAPNPSTTIIVSNGSVTGVFYSATGWRVAGGGTIAPPPPPSVNTKVYIDEQIASKVVSIPVNKLATGVPANEIGPQLDVNGDGKVTIQDALQALMDAGMIKTPPPKVQPVIAKALLAVLQSLYGENLENYPSLPGRVWLLAMILESE